MVRPSPGGPKSPAFWVGATVLALALLAATLGRPTAVADTGPAGYLPADGFRARYSVAGGSRSVEWAVGGLLNVIGSGPMAVYDWAIGHHLDFAAGAARLSTVLARPDGVVTGRLDDFFEVDATAVRTALETSGDGSYRLYTPARLDLPADLAAGRQWSSEGTLTSVSGDAKVSGAYHADFVATAPTSRDEQVRRCLVIAMRQSVDDTVEPAVTRTWCPTLGVIAVDDSLGTWRATTDPAAVPVPDPIPFDWSTADRLQFGLRAANQVGTNSAFLAASTRPGILSNGLLVAPGGATDDLVGVTSGPPMSFVVWRARSGGKTNTSATFGDRTVVATTRRQLVAYDSWGRWLWQTELPDLITVPPVRLGGLVVVGDLDGTVSAYSLATGALQWRHRLSAEIRVGLATSSGRVVAVDQTGDLACFDATGTELWRTSIDPVDGLAISTGPNPVVVAPLNGSRSTVGLSMVDGSQLWRSSVLISRFDLVGLDGQVAIRDHSVIVGLDAATGATRWRWEGEAVDDFAGGGHRLLLLAQNRVILLDDRGRLVREWPLALGMTPTGRGYLSADAGKVAVLAGHDIGIGEVR